MSNYFHPDSDFFRKVLKTDPPAAIPHLTEEELEKNMKKLMPNSWKLRGNTLEGMTEQGLLVQNISPDYILTGTDESGLPVFKKIVV